MNRLIWLIAFALAAGVPAVAQQANPSVHQPAGRDARAGETRPSAALPRPDVRGNDGFSCGFKGSCREMTSCAEATFHLRQCGVSRLDRDGDGVPCEALCRR